MLLENNPYPRDVRVRTEAESLVNAGHSVTVVAPRAASEPRAERIRGVAVRRFRAPDGSAGGAARFVLEYLVGGVALHLAAIRALIRGATVLHIHNPPDIFFPAAALFRAAGRRVVFDHHDLFPETVAVKFGAGAASRFASVCERLTFAAANHVIATNESYAEVARNRGRKRAEEVTIVRNAPPAAWTRLPLRVRDGKLNQVRLAYVGAIAGQDGVGGLAPVLAELRGGPDPIEAQLMIVGDGDARGALQAELERFGVADQVTFTGWVAAERVPQLLEDVDVCVDPTPATDVNQRSTMIKLTEYLALGKPVVGYDLLEARRTAGDAALLVPPGDVAAFSGAVRQLARNPQLRQRLARDARERAIELTWEHSERALLGAYDQLGRDTGTARCWRARGQGG
jgi:glycosyltransferase involved in cell wall biosynthesis